jgi:hypothetical protein
MWIPNKLRRNEYSCCTLIELILRDKFEFSMDFLFDLGLLIYVRVPISSFRLLSRRSKKIAAASFTSYSTIDWFPLLRPASLA